MPFDDLSRRIDSLNITERLMALGITPIDPEFIKAHRSKMSRRYHDGNHPMAGWRDIDIYRLESLAEIDKHVSTLPSSSSAPTAVIDIAQRIKTNMPETMFRLHYFYTDPYLSVRLLRPTTPEPPTLAYVGLWLSRRRLLAIASDADDPPLWRQKWRTRLLG